MPSRPRADGRIDIVAPAPDAVVGPGAASVHIDLILRGADPGALRVIVSNVGSRPNRHDITARFTIVTTGADTHATADIGVDEARRGHPAAIGPCTRRARDVRGSMSSPIST